MDIISLLSSIKNRISYISGYYRLNDHREDLLQETILIYLLLDTPPTDPIAWFTTTFRYRCIMFIRRRKVDRGRFTSLTSYQHKDDNEYAGNMFSDHFSSGILHDQIALRDCLTSSNLKPVYRSILSMYYAGYTDKEISSRLGHSPLSIRTYKNRAIRKLREVVFDDYP